MTPASDILGLDAGDLSRRVASRDISCVDLMKATLARIEAFNPRFNAIVSLRETPSLMEEARQRDEELARGDRLGWMHGFPIAVKDLADAQGLPTTQGSPAIGQRIAAGDALFVQRMKAAGAIVIGKTNTPEFGLGSHTYNPVFGTTRNAYAPERSAAAAAGG
jgi:amidase